MTKGEDVMESIAILVNAGLLYIAYGLALYSLILLVKLIYSYIKVKDKTLAKYNLQKTFIVMLVSALLFYLIGCAGEYRKLKISDETVEKLLSADITQIESEDYSLDITDDKNSEYNVYIRKYSGDTSLYEPPYYYNEIERFFEHRFTDGDSLVVVFARNSDRDFKQIPIVKSHMTMVGIVQGDEVIEISYWDSGNTDEILNKALDYIFTVGLDDNKIID